MAYRKTKRSAEQQARMKAGRDSARMAQQLLGHASEQTTAAIYRRVRGDKVRPAGRS